MAKIFCIVHRIANSELNRVERMRKQQQNGQNFLFEQATTRTKKRELSHLHSFRQL